MTQETQLQSLRRTTTLFTIVGLVASGSHFVFAAFLHTFFDVPLISANICGFSLSFMISYIGHHRFSFRSTRSHKTAIPMYAVTALSGFSANSLTVYAQIHYFGEEHLWFIPVGISVGAAVVFFASRHWAFAEAKTR